MDNNENLAETHSDLDVKVDNEFDFDVQFMSETQDNNLTIITAEEITKDWMTKALQSFDPTNRQYSVVLNENSSTGGGAGFDEIKNLSKNAQNDIGKILKINSLVRQVINEDDIIGMVYEAIYSNLNSDIRISFKNLPENHDPNIKRQVEDLIKQFHYETNINNILSTSILTVYLEGTCIKYLRTNKGHYAIDLYPLGVALVSDYSKNGIPYILIDIRELTNRLQKTTIRGKKNRPLFFDNMASEILCNYPSEVYNAYINKEHYAKLDIRRTGINRICNLNRKYGLTPIFKSLKSSLMLETFDNTDRINAKAKAKKIIHQKLRKEVMGTDYSDTALEKMAYAHQNLMDAWQNPTVLYTSPPFVESVEYVEPKVETTNIETINQYRSRLTSALGISFLNTDGEQTVSTANISIKQLMKTINKIARQEEEILYRWYSLILEENNISQEYCPVPDILDTELLELDIRKDLSELLYSKFNCSLTTAYDLMGFDIHEEVERRKKEKSLGYEDILTVHPTSYNSSGNDSQNVGRPKNTTNNDNEINENKQDYDHEYNQSRE